LLSDLRGTEKLYYYDILGKRKTRANMERALNGKAENGEWNERKEDGTYEERGANRQGKAGAEFGREGAESGRRSPSSRQQQSEKSK
jgi:hypothetical protein